MTVETLSRTINDPFGHSWSIAPHQRDMTAEEIEQLLANMRCGESAKA
jgi:PhnB protein